MVSGFRSWLLMRDPITQRENTGQSCSTRPNLWFTSWNLTTVPLCSHFPHLSFLQSVFCLRRLSQPLSLTAKVDRMWLCSCAVLYRSANKLINTRGTIQPDSSCRLHVGCKSTYFHLMERLYFSGPVTDILSICEQNMLHHYLYYFVMPTSLFYCLNLF